MKKLMILAASVVGVMGFAACGSDDATTETYRITSASLQGADGCELGTNDYFTVGAEFPVTIDGDNITIGITGSVTECFGTLTDTNFSAEGEVYSQINGDCYDRLHKQVSGKIENGRITNGIYINSESEPTNACVGDVNAPWVSATVKSCTTTYAFTASKVEAAE